MRVLLIARLSETSPEMGKLRILAGLGVEPTVLVPDLRNSSESSRFMSEGGVRMVPVPARGEYTDPASLSWSQRAIRRAIRETRPEHVSEWTQIVVKAEDRGHAVEVVRAAVETVAPDHGTSGVSFSVDVDPQ